MASSWSSVAVLGALVVMSGVLAAARRLTQQDSHLVLRIMSLRNCGDPENYVVFHDPVLKLRKDGGHLIDVNATVAKTIKAPHMFQIALTRCREAVSANTCEYFTTWSWRTGLCDMMTMKSMFWSPIVRSIYPPLACPIKEGLYSATNASWDVNHQPLRSMLDGYVWRGVFTMKDQDDVTCLCARGSIEGIRVPGRA